MAKAQTKKQGQTKGSSVKKGNVTTSSNKKVIPIDTKKQQALDKKNAEMDALLNEDAPVDEVTPPPVQTATDTSPK